MFTDFLCLTHTIHGTTDTCTYICWIVMVNIGKHTGPINPMGKLTVSILKARDKSCRRFSTGFCVTQARSRCRALQPATRLEVFHWYPNIPGIYQKMFCFFSVKKICGNVGDQKWRRGPLGKPPVIIWGYALWSFGVPL